MRRGAEGTVVGMPATGPSSVRWRSRGTPEWPEKRKSGERESPVGFVGAKRGLSYKCRRHLCRALSRGVT